MGLNPILDIKGTTGRLVGVWQSLGNTIVSEVLARAGFDYILIDLQHGSIEWSMLGPVIQAVELGGSCPIVRVPWNSPDLIMRALDIGAAGVVVPMVSTAAEARAASAAAHYPPHGIRSFGPMRSYYSADGRQKPPACMVMIETRAGLENIREIAATPGVDGLFLGPVDLALDLGLPLSAVLEGKLSSAIDTMIKVCAEAKIVSGSASLTPQSADDLLAKGIQFVTLSSDVGYLMRGQQPDTELAKRWKSPVAKAS